MAIEIDPTKSKKDQEDTLEIIRPSLPQIGVGRQSYREAAFLSEDYLFFILDHEALVPGARQITIMISCTLRALSRSMKSVAPNKSG